MTSLQEYIEFLETLNEASAIYTDHLIWMSPQYLKLLGYQTLDEVQGKSIYTATHPDELIDQQKNLEHRKNTHQPTAGIWNLRTKNGEYIKVHSQGSVITLDDQTHFIAIARPQSTIESPQYTSSTIKHETLTPLTAAQGYLEIIETRATDPETQNLIKKARTNLEKLHTIIQKYIQETQQLNQLKQ